MDENRADHYMKLLFVHDHLGALGGAEVNLQISATELKGRGHELAFLHGPGTGKSEAAWQASFDRCYSLPAKPTSAALDAILREFKPDLIYLHKVADLDVIEKLLDSGLPVVRMVHDHDLYCMRSYKYNYFSRKVCTRSASAYCVFPCLASIGRNRNGGFPLKWASYRSKRREIRLNQRCRRFVVYSEFSRQELVR